MNTTSQTLERAPLDEEHHTQSPARPTFAFLHAVPDELLWQEAQARAAQLPSILALIAYLDHAAGGAPFVLNTAVDATCDQFNTWLRERVTEALLEVVTQPAYLGTPVGEAPVGEDGADEEGEAP